MIKLNKNGVSLVELLAVVVIMGIMASIAVPLVGTIIKDTKKDAFKADAVVVCEAVRTYSMIEGFDESFFDTNPKELVLVTSGNVNEEQTVTDIQSYLSKDLNKIAEEIKVEISSDNTVTIYMENDDFRIGDSSHCLNPLDKTSEVIELSGTIIE